MESTSPDRADLHVAPSWEALLERVEPSDGGAEPGAAIHVLGDTDSGKSTLCRWLGAELAARGHEVAAVDCDPGQGRLGPPTTVGLAREPVGPDSRVDLRFVGAVTPTGHFLQLMSGVAALDRLARSRGADVVVLDGSGFMETEAGREYHTLLTEVTVAGREGVDGRTRGHIVALQRGHELEEVLRVFHRRQDVNVHRLGVSPAVVPRSRARRRRTREARLRRHFKDASRVALPTEDRGLQGRVPSLAPREAPLGLLVAPLDERGLALGPHLLEGVEGSSRHPVLHLRGPRIDPDAVTSIQFGSLHLEGALAPG